MRWTHRLILLAGAITFCFLIVGLGPLRILGHIRAFGVIGFLAILPLPVLEHFFNALAWRFTFPSENAKCVPFKSLFKLRVIGDGINYLTPTRTIFGELVKPELLGPVAPDDIKNASVVISGLSQALGQVAFILVGIAFMLLGRFNALNGSEIWMIIGGALFVAASIAFSLFILAAQTQNGNFFCDFGGPVVRGVREKTRRYLRDHPVRLALSVVLFTIGYACGMIEVAVICSFMNLPIGAARALVIEALSNAFEAALCMVPAKIGTQEAGKVLIFKAMGYTAGQGLSFGIIRHIRELIWASAGFLIYALTKRKLKREQSPISQSPLEPVGLSESQIL
jgi:hypothetical protein